MDQWWESSEDGEPHTALVGGVEEDVPCACAAIYRDSRVNARIDAADENAQYDAQQRVMRMYDVTCFS